MNMLPAPRGYIAIVAAIILSAILTALASTESTGIFWARYSQLDSMHRTESSAQANACAYEGLVAFAENPDLTTPTTLSIESNNTDSACSLVKILPGSNMATLYVESLVSNTRVLLEIVVTENQVGHGLSVESWREVTSIPY